MAFSLITVTGTFLNSQGNPCTGRLYFRLSKPIRDSVTMKITEPSQLSVRLDHATGSFSQPMVANNDANTTPTDSVYHVIENIFGATIRHYDIVVPFDAPSATVDLATLASF